MHFVVRFCGVTSGPLNVVTVNAGYKNDKLQKLEFPCYVSGFGFFMHKREKTGHQVVSDVYSCSCMFMQN